MGDAPRDFSLQTREAATAQSLNGARAYSGARVAEALHRRGSTPSPSAAATHARAVQPGGGSADRSAHSCFTRSTAPAISLWAGRCWTPRPARGRNRPGAPPSGRRLAPAAATIGPTACKLYVSLRFVNFANRKRNFRTYNSYYRYLSTSHTHVFGPILSI